jgi:Protein of unknown function (DUF4231)
MSDDPDAQPKSSGDTAVIEGEPSPTIGRLEDQIAWYERKSAENQQRFKILKGVQLLVAATIPVVATLDAHAALTASLGALIVVVEGFQQLNQYQQNWTLYRSNAEALKHEKFLFLARAGPYASVIDGHALLADRIEGLISQEHAKWVSARREEGERKEAGPRGRD